MERWRRSYEVRGFELRRNRDGVLYFSAPRELFGSGTGPMTYHVEAAGETWLRNQGFDEGDRISTGQYVYLWKQNWLSTGKSGTLGPAATATMKSTDDEASTSDSSNHNEWIVSVETKVTKEGVRTVWTAQKARSKKG